MGVHVALLPLCPAPLCLPTRLCCHPTCPALLSLSPHRPPSACLPAFAPLPSPPPGNARDKEKRVRAPPPLICRAMRVTRRSVSVSASSCRT